MGSSPYQILVVGSKSRHLHVIREALAGDMYSVLTAELSNAVEMVAEHDFVLAIVDSGTADLQCTDFAARLRGTEKGRQLPIVCLIIADQAAGQQRLRDLSADGGAMVDFMYEPPDSGLLQAKVRVLADLHRQRRDMAERLDDMKRLSKVNALMIGALSHDIRTPLAALALNAELVIRKAEQQGLRQAGERIKAATAKLGRQVDHLVNLSSVPGDDLRPALSEADLAALVRSRIDIATSFMLADIEVTLQDVGNANGWFDANLISEALDQLLLLCAIHGAGVAVRAQVDGQSTRSLVLRITMDMVLPEGSIEHLFGGAEAVPGLPPSQVGPGLHAIERIARAHGGSFVGRSREREGTLFELILPRGDG